MRQFNRVRQLVASAPGTGAVILGAALPGRLTMAAGGVANGQKITYEIVEGITWEIGRGTYTSSSTSFTRDTVELTSAGNQTKINFGAAAFVMLPVSADTLNHIREDAVSIDLFTGSDPVDVGAISNGDNHTAALNSAWLEGDGIAETDDFAYPDDQGLPIFCPGGHDTVYTFVVSQMESRFIKAYGRGSYRLIETSYTDENGDVIAVSGTYDQIFPLSPTPQYLYAPPDSGGDRNINFIDAPHATLFDPRYFGASMIRGNKTGYFLKYGGNVYVDGHMQLERPIEHPTAITLVGRRQFRFTRFGNRLLGMGTENGQRAFTYEPDLDGHPYFTTLAEAQAASVQDVWIKTATPGSGERAWLEEDHSALDTGATYDTGDAFVTGGRGYFALEDNLLGSNFTADLAAGKYRDDGLRTKTTYDLSGLFLPANIATVGRLGTKRAPRDRGDPSYPGAWNMSVRVGGRDNIHNVLDGEEMDFWGYRNASGSVYVSSSGGLGSENFDGNRILTDTYFMGGGIGGKMIVSRKNFFGGRSVLKNTPRARFMTAIGDEAGISIGCSTYGGADPMTFELETDEPFPAQYGAIVGTNCRVVPNGFTSSFFGGYGNFDFATIVSNDIVLGHLNVLSATGAIGGRFLIANRHPDTALNKFFNIAHYAFRSQGLLGGDLENGGVIVNADVAADIETATTCDQILGAFHVRSRLGNRQPFWVNDSDQAIFTGTTADAEVVEIVSTDGGAGAGPTINLYRDDPSPTTGTNGPGIRFYARNGSNIKTQFASMRVSYTDITNGSEDAVLSFRTVLAGVIGTRLFMGAGLYTGALADMGVDTLNTLAYYVNGKKIVGAQKTGWTVPTSTLLRAALADYTAQTISASPTQAQVQNIDDRVEILNNTLAALIFDIHKDGTGGHQLLAVS